MRQKNRSGGYFKKFHAEYQNFSAAHRLVPVLLTGNGKRQVEVVKNDESSGEFSLLIREILKHVVQHPAAKDSVDGIHKFWLSSQTAHQSREQVRVALDHLVEEKAWLTRKASGASATLYGLDINYLAEVRDFLRRSGDAD